MEFASSGSYGKCIKGLTPSEVVNTASTAAKRGASLNYLAIKSGSSKDNHYIIFFACTLLTVCV